MTVQPRYTTERVWTVPNIISMLRLLGVPLFLWLVLGPREDGWAVAVLMLAGMTDWLDGKIARATNQISRLGEMLDPLADRLYIFATIVALGLRGIFPWWFVAILVARDLLMVALVPVLRTRGFTSLPVHFVGKAATFLLLYALPLALLGAGGNLVADIARTLGWACALWGALLYWWAGLLYVEQTVRLVQASDKLPSALRPGGRERRES